MLVSQVLFNVLINESLTIKRRLSEIAEGNPEPTTDLLDPDSNLTSQSPPAEPAEGRDAAGETPVSVWAEACN